MMCLLHDDDFTCFSTCNSLGGIKSICPQYELVNSGRFDFPKRNKIRERSQISRLLGRRAKGNLARCFHSFLHVFKKGFLQKISHFDEKE